MQTNIHLFIESFDSGHRVNCLRRFAWIKRSKHSFDVCVCTAAASLFTHVLVRISNGLR